MAALTVVELDTAFEVGPDLSSPVSLRYPCCTDYIAGLAVALAIRVASDLHCWRSNGQGLEGSRGASIAEALVLADVVDRNTHYFGSPCFD